MQKDDSQNTILLDHNYDGIQELDNPLPNWWLVTFFITIIFGFIYWIHYTFGEGPTLLDELKIAMAQLPKAQEAVLSEDEMEQRLNAAGALEQGREIFSAKCAACHGAEGQGIIGPNLTDRFWIHGSGKKTDILMTVNKGVLEKGMPAWGEQLKEQEIIFVSGFVASLKNTKPKNAKPAEGQEY